MHIFSIIMFLLCHIQMYHPHILHYHVLPLSYSHVSSSYSPSSCSSYTIYPGIILIFSFIIFPLSYKYPGIILICSIILFLLCDTPRYHPHLLHQHVPPRSYTHVSSLSSPSSCSSPTIYPGVNIPRYHPHLLCYHVPSFM